MKKLLLTLSGLAFVSCLHAQTSIFTESFDGTWTIPATLSPAWSCPQTGDNEWHKNNYTTGWTQSSGAYNPTGAAGTGNSARFHSYEANAGTIGELISPVIDMSSYTTGINKLSFYYINTSGTDFADVYLSTDGGASWGSSLLHVTEHDTWTKFIIDLGMPASGIQIKFTATSDDGSTDIGIDQVRVYNTVEALSGILTIDPAGSGANNFLSFTAAVSTLNDAGMGSGGVTFKVRDDAVFIEDPPVITATGTEAGPVRFLRDSSGTARPLIRANGGSGSTDAAFTLQGCDYITFDGIDVSINTGTALEYGFYLANESSLNGAQHNSIRNSRITLNRSNTASIGVLQDVPFSISVAEGANSYNTYENLAIENVYQGIYLVGDGSPNDLSCLIAGCTIGAATADDIGNGTAVVNAIYLSNQSDIIIHDNEIRNVRVNGSGDLFGCYLDGCKGANMVYNNRIHDLKSAGTSTSSVIAAMQLDVSNTTKVFNNEIYGISHALSSASASIVVTGIKATSGTVELYFNTVSMNLGANVSNSAFHNTSASVYCQNNIFANFSTAGATSKRYCCYVYSGTISISSHNLLYIAPGTNNFTGYKGADCTNLQVFAAAISPVAPVEGMEHGSSAADPGFAGPDDPTFVTATPASHSGIPVTGIDRDINGTYRDPVRPTIGSRETTMAQLDQSAPGISDVTVVNGTNPFVTISAMITDNSAATAPAGVALWYRLQGSGTAFISLDADAKPSGSINGNYSWTTSVSSLPPGNYEFYIAARDAQAAPAGTWINPIWKTSFTGFSGSDPPNFISNPDAAANVRIFSRPSEFSGSYTIGAGEDYPTVAAAAAALSNGVIGGNTWFELTGNYTGEGSTPATINITAYLGVDSSRQLVFRPRADVTSLLTTAFDPGTGAAVISISGAKYVTFDGRPGGTGSSVMWVIRNTRTIATIGPAVQFINDASFNSLNYMQLEGQNISNTTGTVIFGTTTGTTGNDNNSISHCYIRDRSDAAGIPTIAVYSAGTTGKENSGNSLVSNQIFNFWNPATNSYGVFINGGSSAWTLSGNSFYQTAARTATSAKIHYAVQVLAGNSYLITGNFIGGSEPGCLGTPWTIQGNYANIFYGISLTADTLGISEIQGNTVRNFSMFSTGTSRVWQGINTAGGHIKIGTAAANVIGANEGNGSVSITTTGQDGSSYGIFNSSTGSVNISNNGIGSVTINPASNSHSFYGIFNSGGYNTIIHNNLIGSLSTANSIFNNTGATNTGQELGGILVAPGSMKQQITDNIIVNLSQNYQYTGSNGSLFGISVRDGGNTISGNQVYNLTTNTPSSGNGNNACLMGIGLYTVSAYDQLITLNSIYNLKNTYSGSNNNNACGIVIYGNPTGTNTVSRNNIHSIVLSSSATNSIIQGIYANLGNFTYHNNMIRLGFDAGGTPVTNGHTFYGINDASTSNRYFFNSVYIGGTGISGTTSSTYALYSDILNNTRYYQNNIFCNLRSGGVTGKHYAIRVRGSGVNPTGLNCDYNVYHTDGTTFGYYGSERSTFEAWKAATGKDGHSRAGDPYFVNPDGGAVSGDLHILTNQHTPVEHWGISIAGIIEDFDGDVRDDVTPVDIGADAGNFIGIDADSKVIAPESQIVSGSIPSTANGPGNAVEVFKFTVADPGSSDQWPTKVATISVHNANPGNSADWTDHIRGIILKKGNTVMATDTAIISDTSIVVNLNAGELDVADNSTVTLTLSVYLNDTGIIDGKKLRFSIPQVNHGWIADPEWSTFATDFGAEVLSEEMSISVTATRISISVPPVILFGAEFTAKVTPSDQNGNTDMDYTGNVNLSLFTGPGNLSTVTGLVQSLNDGGFEWTDLVYDALGYLQLQAVAEGLDTAVSDSMVSSHETIIGQVSGNYYYPFGTYYGYIRNAALYKASEIKKHGQILDLAWDVAIPTNYNTPIKIYLKTTTANTVPVDNWANLTTNATLVYEGTQQFSLFGWKFIDLLSDFDYDNDNLLVLTEMNYGGSGTGYFNTSRFSYHETNNMNATSYNSGTPPGGTLGPNIIRPLLKIGFPADMIYFHSTTLQDTLEAVDAGGLNQKVLEIRINTLGNQNPLNLTELILSAEGTDSLAEISNAKVFYTGNSAVFSAVSQFGSAIANPGYSDFSITGQQSLLPGTNYFWLTYDISPTAVGSHHVDACCKQMTIDGLSYAPKVISPAGAKEISQKTLSGLYIGQVAGDYAPIGIRNSMILWLAFNVNGPSTGSLLLNSVKVKSKNNDDGDISVSGVKLFNIDQFALSVDTTQQIGTAVDFVSGFAEFQGLDYNIPSGWSYLCLTYDIDSTATISDTVDAMIPANHITVEGQTWPEQDEDPYGYKILLQPLSGSYTVGTGGDFPTLTGNGGLFYWLNNLGMKGNVTVKVVSDLAEDNYYDLNQWPEAGTGNFSLAIRPSDSVLRQIAGTFDHESMVSLSGCRNVTFDGSYDGHGRFLSLESSGTILATVVSLSDGASNINIGNCRIRSGANTDECFGIFVESCDTGIVIENNKIQMAEYGIVLLGDQDEPVKGTRIINNTIGDYNEPIGHQGILGFWCDSLLIAGNDIFGDTSSLNEQGMAGIYTEDCSYTMIRKNNIHDIAYTGGGGYGCYGIHIGHTSTGRTEISNNFIYNIRSDGDLSTLYWNPMGIFVDVFAGADIWHNTIFLDGNTLGKSNYDGMGIGIGISSYADSMDIRNNIICNLMGNYPDGITDNVAYSVYADGDSTVFGTIDYNDYYVDTVIGILGFLGEDRFTLGEWQAATGQDAHSASFLPTFVSPEDLHLTVSNDLGTPLTQVTDDIDAEPRSVLSPDMGADETGTPSGGGEIIGTLKYVNTAQTPMSNTTVILKNNLNQVVAQTLTQPDGSYQFTQVPPGAYTVSGETTKAPGGWNSIDALLILKHFVGLQMLGAFQALAADVDKTGFINSIDALLVQKRFVGIIPGFNGGDWLIETLQVTVVQAGQQVAADLRVLCYGDVNGSFVPPAK